MKKRSAYWKAKNIFDCWMLSLFFKGLIEHKTIPLELFMKPMKVKFDDGLTTFKIQAGNVNVITGTSENLYRSTLGTCFIAFDEALLDLFGKRPARDNNDLNSLRMIIYMMRCSIAHDPAEPKWEIRHPKYKKLIKINEINFKIDFTDLDGKIVIFEHHDGSSGLSKLMDYCLKTIKAKEEGNNREENA